MDDNQFIYKLVNSEGWLTYIGDRGVTNLNEARDYIQNIINKSNYHYSVLVQKKTNQSIGVVTYLKRDNQEFPDFGFALLSEYQKQGFAYEASKSYLEALFAQTGPLKIIGITLSDNAASIKLLNRLGFRWVFDQKENNEKMSYFSLLKEKDMSTGSKIHSYKTTIKWTGDNGIGTINYQSYNREHTISIDNKSDISGSSDVAFRGDKTKHNPEDLFVSSLSACHMLWFLHLCSQAGVVILNYIDNATGKMEEVENGGGRFIEVTLNPLVTVADNTMIAKANELHKKANALCFIANSVNFPVYHNPTTKSKLEHH